MLRPSPLVSGNTQMMTWIQSLSVISVWVFSRFSNSFSKVQWASHASATFVEMLMQLCALQATLAFPSLVTQKVEGADAENKDFVASSFVTWLCLLCSRMTSFATGINHAKIPAFRPSWSALLTADTWKPYLWYTFLLWLQVLVVKGHNPTFDHVSFCLCRDPCEGFHGDIIDAVAINNMWQVFTANHKGRQSRSISISTVVCCCGCSSWTLETRICNWSCKQTLLYFVHALRTCWMRSREHSPPSCRWPHSEDHWVSMNRQTLLRWFVMTRPWPEWTLRILGRANKLTDWVKPCHCRFDLLQPKHKACNVLFVEKGVLHQPCRLNQAETCLPSCINIHTDQLLLGAHQASSVWHGSLIQSWHPNQRWRLVKELCRQYCCHLATPVTCLPVQPSCSHTDALGLNSPLLQTHPYCQ